MDDSLLITPTSIALRKAYPWANSVQKILRKAQPFRFRGDNLFFGSDYGGDHKGSRYKAYCFLIADSTPSDWFHRQRAIRDRYLTDGRRVSFKRLDDPQRQRALIPLLDAANSITGHVVAVLIDKRMKRLCAPNGSSKGWAKTIKMQARWNDPAFEAMARKAHFFSLCVAQWSKPRANVTWITDEDEFVANEARLDDAQNYAARISSLYSPHPLGVFAMNTTAIDDEKRSFEDFVAIPDLVAGMLTEVYTKLSAHEHWKGGEECAIEDVHLSIKSQLLSDWFWNESFSLRRTTIVIEKYDANRYGVRELTTMTPISSPATSV